MILFGFRYQDPWAEENFTLRDFVQQGQAKQRQDQQVEINRQTLDKLLTKLSLKDIVGLDHAREYLRHKYRQNCKANTLKNDFTTITLFLSYLKSCGKSQLHQISRADLEAYVEHEQDRGLKIISVSNRLGSLYAFLRYLIEHDLADAGLLTRKIQLKVPDALPRAMDPDDVKCLLTVLDDVRNRAMILLLLRSGMRIECLQQLLGHSSIEMTLRYARLSDKTREHEYFKAMAIIEGEPIDEPDQRDHQLPPLF